jgi:hypothetical protein
MFCGNKITSLAYPTSVKNLGSSFLRLFTENKSYINAIKQNQANRMLLHITCPRDKTMEKVYSALSNKSELVHIRILIMGNV